MSQEQQRPAIRAGQAFLEATEADPQAKAALARAIHRLRLFAQAAEVATAPCQQAMQAFGEVFALLKEARAIEERLVKQEVRRTFDSLRAERNRVFAELAAEVASSPDEVETQLAELGFEPPRDLEDWEALARLVEQKPDLLTLEEIYLWAIAWAQREILRRRFARGELPVQSAAAANSKRPSDECPPGDVGIRHDEYDPRIVWCLGKRIYLGEDTQISRLFWLLAKPIGRAHTLWDVQRAIDVGETRRDMDDTGEEYRLACQRVRRAMARLRRALRDADADAHLLIVAGGDRANPEYTMVLRFGAAK